MKNELRKDLLITREDILTHICARNADPDGEEFAAMQAGPIDVFLGLILRGNKKDD